MKRKIQVPEQILRMYKVYRSDILENGKRPLSRKVLERQEQGCCFGRQEGFILAFALCNKITVEEASMILVVLCVENKFLIPIPQMDGRTDCVAEWVYNDAKKIAMKYDLVVTERNYETFSR